MKLFSWFSEPEPNVAGSHCDTVTRVDANFIESTAPATEDTEDPIAEAYDSAQERGDQVMIQGEWNNEVICRRTFSDGSEPEHGPT